MSGRESDDFLDLTPRDLVEAIAASVVATGLALGFTVLVALLELGHLP